MAAEAASTSAGCSTDERPHPGCRPPARRPPARRPRRLGYTVAGVAELLGPMAIAALDRDQALPAQRVTATSTPAPRWCGCSPWATRSTVARRPRRCRPWASTARQRSAWSPRGDAVVALCDLRPYAADGVDWWMASDLGEVHRATAPRGPRARHRRRLDDAGVLDAPAARRPGARPRHRLRRAGPAPRRPRQAGRRHRHLQRALDFARFNAALDGASGTSSGSMLDPVAGERFGLVVSNPPFVITPRSADVPLFEYRDGGRPGTRRRDLVRSVGAHLEPGGVAQFLGNWEVAAGPTGASGCGLARRHRARRLGRAARGAGPGAVRRDLGRDGGHHSAPPTSRPCTRRGSTTSQPATSRRSGSAS